MRYQELYVFIKFVSEKLTLISELVWIQRFAISVVVCNGADNIYVLC